MAELEHSRIVGREKVKGLRGQDARSIIQGKADAPKMMTKVRIGRKTVSGANLFD